MKRHISFSLILLALPQTTHPVHPGAAASGIIVAGTIGAGAIYGCNRYSAEIGNGLVSTAQHISTHALGYTMGTGGMICALIGASILIPRTPQYRWYKARKIINQIATQPLIIIIENELNAHATNEKLIQTIENTYAIYNHPHAICANMLARYIDDLQRAIDYINLVTQEKPQNKSMLSGCHEYRQQANHLIASLTHTLTAIKQLPNFMAECKAYDDMIDALKMRAVVSNVADEFAANTKWQNIRGSIQLVYALAKPQ